MVYKYGGKLVYALRDELGLIEVVETTGVRALHFGSLARQSAMSLTEPDRIELSYLRAMLINLLYTPQPGNALLLGLGGGSLAKFLFQHCQTCRIQVVEYRSGVVPVARRFFGLPESSRIQIHLEDCRSFMVRTAQVDAGVFEHIYVDAFDSRGLADAVSQHDFFPALKTVLHPRGMLAVNLWGNESASFKVSLRLLQLHFPGRVFRLKIPGRGNVIAFAVGGGFPVVRPRDLGDRACVLEMQTGIEFSRMVRLIQWPQPQPD